MADGISPTILAGWSVAVLLFAAALLASVTGGLRRASYLAMAGMMAAGAVTLYSHDVMAMPKICAALIIGGAAGLAAGRAVPRSALPALLVALVGLAGLAAIFIGLAAWRNPHAFGLLDDITDRLLDQDAALIGAMAALGAMACSGAVSILWGRARGFWGGPALGGVMLLAMAGAIRAFGAGAEDVLLLCGMGFAVIAGQALTGWALGSGVGPALALVGGFAGWAVAASAFLMENPAMVVAGGLAGAAGSLFALRLCGRAGRKGLADAGSCP